MIEKIIIDTNKFKKETFSSKYLYGVPGSYFKDMTYKEAIEEKIRLGKQVEKNLTEVVCDIDFITEGDCETYSVVNERLRNVRKAIEHNELLLKDMELKNDERI